MERPNIVVIMAEHHRYDALGCAGHPVLSTPHLDSLATRGVRFEHAYCQSPLCMSSRASFLTGLYCRETGVRDNSCFVRPSKANILHSLQKAGYSTAEVGKMHFYVHGGSRRGNHTRDFEKHLRSFGFDYADEIVGKMASRSFGSPYTDALAEAGLLEAYRADYTMRLSEEKPAWYSAPSVLPVKHYIDTHVGERAAQWIADRSGGPFFLWVGFAGVHDPWDAPGKYAKMYDPRKIDPGIRERPTVDVPYFVSRRLEQCSTGSMTQDRARELRAQYYGNVSLIDAMVGKIVSSLRKRDLLDNTWIIYTADHGEMLGDHGLLQKSVFYRPAVNVPLIIRPPKCAASGEVSDSLVELTDVSATILDLAGARPLKQSHGRTLTPECDRPGCGPGETPREAVFSELDNLVMARTKERNLVVSHSTGPLQLFDLSRDPDELTNLAHMRRGRKRLDQVMETWMEPFLSGQTP